MDEQHTQHTDAELAQQREQAIDTAQGPGPVLDQNTPAPMPLFNEHERMGRDLQSAIAPEEFAELSQRSGEELDHVRAIGETEEPGVAGRAAQSRPENAENADQEETE
jgi:hypothetical protein